MPTPKPDESKDDFMGRCIPMVMDEGMERDQATAMCTKMFNGDAKMASRKTKGKPIIAMRAEITIEAAAGDGEHKGPPTFDVVAYKGGALEVDGWDLPVVIDIAGMDFARSVIGDLFHNHDQLVGHATEKAKTESEVRLRGVMSAATQYTDQVVTSAANGFPWEASVEVRPTAKGVEEIAAGKKAKVNGQEFTGPIYVARKSTMSGFGFVPHGADPTTEVTIAASAASKEKEMDEKLQAFIEAMLPGVDVTTLSDEAIANLEADMKGKAGKRVNGAARTDDIFAERKAEVTRRKDIRDIADKFIEMRGADVEEIEAIEKMYDVAIESKMSAQDFRLEMYESGMPNGVTVYAPKPRTPQLDGDVIEAAICLQGNLPAKSLDAAFSDKTLQAAKDRFRGGIGLKQIWRMSAKANGYHYDGDDVTAEMQKYAFRERPQGIRASGGYSTYDLASVLANTANKFLLEGWGAGEMVWQTITDIVNVRDFKEASFFKLSGNLKYKKIAPGGQIEHGQVSTDSYTTQADTYGIMFAIDRTAMINDDLSAITRIPLEMGYGANDAFNEVFWTEFLDHAAFFDSSTHGNVVASGVLSGATGMTALTVAETAFLNQTKPNGTPLGILPTVLLVPPGYKRAAMALMSSTLVVGSTGPLPDGNTFQGNYNVQCSAYIANALYSGYSTVKWYLLCNRPGFSTMLTAFLNGRQAPTVEQSEMVFNTLGVQMRAYHDFGTNKMEYRAGVQSTGAT